MKTDKVFILMLVILLPLTGCIDVSDNADAQEETPTQQSMNNHHPVIFGNAYFGDYWHGSNSSTSTDVLVGLTLHALDFDGNVTDFGIDVDKDGVIDLPVQNWQEAGPERVMIANSDTYNWKNPIEFDSWGSGDVEYCHQWLSIIAIDDDGDITVEPFMVIFAYDDEAETCTNESTSG
jgi:hypothetical protein